VSQNQSTSPAKIWTALITVYLVWGSTYLGIAVLVKTAPPLISMGVRFMLAAVILGLLLTIFKDKKILKVTKPQLASTALLGGLLLGFGLGNLTLAQRFVPSGVAALIVAALPIWVTLFQYLAGVIPSRRTLLGVGLGIVGVAIIVLPGGAGPAPGADESKVSFWMFMILLGNMAWAFGTFITPRISVPKNSLVLTTYQMFFGGVTLLLAGFIRGERVNIQTLTARSPASIWAWIYLIFIGSILGYGAYIWLITHVSLSLASTYAYVNPLVAVLLGVLILSEPFNLLILIGGSVVILGVALVLQSNRSSRVKIPGQ
jgi:drug/metabolite transporter (DMT)-like permease